MKNRRKSRELALQILYAREIGNHQDPGDIPYLLEHMGAESGCNDEVRAYAELLITSAATAATEIDEIIQLHSANWELKRMAAIDRNVLRLAVTEMRVSSDVPFKVVIDEAIELAKEYGAEDSGKFVNGVIDSIRKQMQQPK
jgi:N utilization substance protein B